MAFSGYAQLWADRRVRALLIAAFFARIPAMTAPLVLTLFVVRELDAKFVMAGVVAAASTVGAGIGAPWRGRLIDRLGMRRAIIPSIVAVAVLYPLAAMTTSPLVLAPIAFGMGLFLIPIFSIVRLSLSVMVPQEQHRTAFAADSVIAEAGFIIGPAVGGLLVIQAGADVSLALIGACEVVAGLIFWRLDPPTKSVPSPDAPQVDDTVPSARVTWVSSQVLFLFLISAGTMIALISTDLGIVAELDDLDHVGSVGIVFGAWGLASLVGGLLYGALDFSVRPTWLLLALGVTLMPVGLADSVWVLALCVVPTGFLCAPTMSAASEWIAKLVPEQRRGEAMGWQGTAFTMGGAASSPVVGAAIDGVGPWGGFLVGGSIATAIALVAFGGQLVPRWRPDEVDRSVSAETSR
ncbi:MFS transporter [Aeromicrobium endophyticum]|uniref:MFS transporter n=1 Tax=Aeromicrobium endophyticum TaxID=2292704 RepID=A0A371PBX7_9ACTN|nr:MFS transporter [Aeromicrobium endophyticum]REK73454.1 MFS transporter [Aeromicrobium endophyticum]